MLPGAEFQKQLNDKKNKKDKEGKRREERRVNGRVLFSTFLKPLQRNILKRKLVFKMLKLKLFKEGLKGPEDQAA